MIVTYTTANGEICLFRLFATIRRRHSSVNVRKSLKKEVIEACEGESAAKAFSFLIKVVRAVVFSLSGMIRTLFCK